MSNDDNTLDRDLAQIARQHYRPEPLTQSEKSALLARVRDRADARQRRRQRRTPRIAWGSAAAAAVACVLVVLFDGGPPPAPAPTSGAFDSLLIPSEAYAADLGTGVQETLPPDYQAIEMLLIAR